ncbi:hypothetical protein LP7551_01635 [Roseibium album]|nr:hypothetical protein LP7551_01635 [Roseibium album]
MRFVKLGCFVLAVLMSAVSSVHSSEEEEKKHCPSYREWTSTIDPENRPLFWLFAQTVVSNAGKDFEPSEGLEYLKLASFLLIHSFQRTSEFEEELAPLFFDAHEQPETRDLLGQGSLDEIGKCFSGEIQVDCAEMAFRKGYIKSLDEYSKDENFREYMEFFEQACQIKERVNINE